MTKYVIYKRVSTKRQGQSGLGLEAQQEICLKYISESAGVLVAAYQDIESGTHRKRPGLLKAIERCKKENATLVIAKLDRLARDVEFTFKVINSGIQIHFCDMPVINTMILGVFAATAQYERELISKRTKDALAVKKAQGVKLGRPKKCKTGEGTQASSNNRKQAAINNPSNKRIWEVVKLCTKDFTELNTQNFAEAAIMLQRMDVFSSTGLVLTKERVRSAYYNLRAIYGGHVSLRRSSVDYKLMRARGMTDDEIRAYYKYQSQENANKQQAKANETHTDSEIK